jgi:hypothetical protein
VRIQEPRFRRIRSADLAGRASYNEALKSITSGHNKPKIPTTNVIAAKIPCGDFTTTSNLCPNARER